MKPIPVLFDGDMGADDLWALAVLLAHPEQINLLGIATVFGNVSQPFATRNVLNFLHWLKIDGLRVVQGVNLPYDGMRPFGDDAYGTEGVGDVILPVSPATAEETDIAAWYGEMLDSTPDPVTILVTGPATNLALFLEKHPDKTHKIREIVLMGGAITPPGVNGEPVPMRKGEIRKGNITPYAEFNAYQDPNALNILLKSGVRCIFMAADATQHMVLTPPRQYQIRALDPLYGDAFHRMLMAVEALDRAKFGVDGPFIHDPNVAVYLLHPDLYSGVEMPDLSFMEALPENEHRGETIQDGKNGNARWLNSITDLDAVFAEILKSVKIVIDDARSNNRARPAE